LEREVLGVEGLGAEVLQGGEHVVVAGRDDEEATEASDVAKVEVAPVEGEVGAEVRYGGLGVDLTRHAEVNDELVATREAEEDEFPAAVDAVDALARGALEIAVFGARGGIDPSSLADGSAGEPVGELAPDRFDLGELGHGGTIGVPLPQMGYAYLFALVVGLGIVLIQAVMGSKDADVDGDGDVDGFDKELAFEGDVDDIDADGDGDIDAVDHDLEGSTGAMGGVADLATLFLSVRFWVFFCLGFGLGGTLLTYFTGAGSTATAVTALGLGVVSGLMAALAFRTLKRTASSAVENTAQAAVGRVARVVVPPHSERLGKVRIELSGQTFDLLARTEGPRIDVGEAVIIEEVEGEMAKVSRAPKELQ